jgi:AGZA family xanthine/uracil permease-like MFS transporter
VAIPFALATVIGGIDCTESAAAAGDEYHTGRVIAVEAFATLVASLCGGVIQTTPYIGHPAYKAMGGRAAYTLATAVFVGGAGTIGYFGYLYLVIPKAAVFPILIFIGLEITAQSFHATPRRHYAAVAMACVPAMAALVMAFADRLLVLAIDPTSPVPDLDQLAGKSAPLAVDLQIVRMLSAGFIVTSLIWASTVASLIDRRLRAAAAYLTAAAALSLLGIMHSPLKGNPLTLPWNVPPLPDVSAGLTPFHFAAAYVVAAVLLLAWSCFLPAANDAPPHGIGGLDPDATHLENLDMEC